MTMESGSPSSMPTPQSAQPPLPRHSQTEKNMVNDVADSVFSKYATVWIWSVLFGSSSVLIFETSGRLIGKWGGPGLWGAGAALIFAILQLVSGLSALSATALSLRFLVRSIIPLLWSGSRPPSEDENDFSRHQLARIGNLLILALLCATLGLLLNHWCQPSPFERES